MKQPPWTIVYATAIGMLFLWLIVSWASAAENNFQTRMLDPVIKMDQKCSGSIVKSEADKSGKVETVILTAKHCVDRSREGQLNIEVTDRGRPVYTKNVWYDVDRKDPVHDISTLILRDRDTIYPTVKIAETVLAKAGDDVFVVGYPHGDIQTITKGLFTGYQYVPQFKSAFIRATPSLTFGNSGGALFQVNGNEYELIGVTSMKRRDNHFMNLFVPLKEVRNFLRIAVPSKPAAKFPAMPTPPTIPDL